MYEFRCVHGLNRSFSRRANTAHCLKTNYARTSLFRDYFFNRITIIWNGIPEDIKVANSLRSSNANSNLFTLSDYIMFLMATSAFVQDYLSQVSPCEYSKSLLLLVSMQSVIYSLIPLFLSTY